MCPLWRAQQQNNILEEENNIMRLWNCSGFYLDLLGFYSYKKYILFSVNKPVLSIFYSTRNEQRQSFYLLFLLVIYFIAT